MKMFYFLMESALGNPVLPNADPVKTMFSDALNLELTMDEVGL
jgi:hypothetical protein